MVNNEDVEKGLLPNLFQLHESLTSSLIKVILVNLFIASNTIILGLYLIFKKKYINIKGMNTTRAKRMQHLEK